MTAPLPDARSSTALPPKSLAPGRSTGRPPSPVIDVAGLDEDAIADGPGLRFVLFVQGCPRSCPGCHNPQTHAFGVGNPMTVDELADRILSNPLTTGITFSGGEPLCQAEPLALLAERLRAARPTLDIAIYTGYTFEELLAEASPARLRLLRAADILVDGPFVASLADRLLLFRGSSNQRILDLPLSLSSRSPTPTSSPDWLPA
jgi:anaerobic ribonucleoside-triphosphate reductase activating protein